MSGTDQLRLKALLLNCLLIAQFLVNFSPVQLAAADQSRSAGMANKVLTGKETLAGKATDEQRTNNCNVPVEKRGTKPRPDECSQELQTKDSGS